ncbi:arylsulfatase J-like isoform X1 [Ptychodera flava]|uniref:arylsulfatase J-like isoform X1 n=2 Tax=Ptychodera flava TaxID=63121 RepID=UPI00396A5C59
MRAFSRLAVLSLFTFGYIWWQFPLKNHGGQLRKPNIIFILADDLGWADVGYNNPYLITPTIDKLAREGVILNQSYVSQSCSPSRAAFMTGYYSYRLGFQTGGIRNKLPYGLPLNLTALPRKLHQLGYSTYMVGKWHLGYCKEAYTPTRRGFDKFYGYYLAGQDYYTHFFVDGLDLHDNFNPDWSQNGTYSSYLFSDKAVDMIDSHDKAKPFFMYLAFQSVHAPMEVPRKYFDMYPEVKGEKRRTLLGMVTALDDGIAKVVRALKTNGLWENTLLIFSSDNGAPLLSKHEGSNWPLLGMKQQLFEGGTRAVGFIHGNMLKNTGYTYNGMMHIVDWYPTLVSIAGGQVQDPEIDGINLWDALSTNSPSPRNEMVYNIIPEWKLAAIRVGNFKLLLGKNQHNACWIPPEEAKGKWGSPFCFEQKKDAVYLFNLKDDPCERTNLAEMMPDKVNQLTRRLEEKSAKVVPAIDKKDVSLKSLPRNFGGVWSPGWC